MANRNRVIYQSEALYAGPSPATGHHFFTGILGSARHDSNGIPLQLNSHDVGWSKIKQLQRVQTVNYSFNLPRVDINQFGELAHIDRVILDSPTVTLDFSYLFGSFANEHNCGFNITESGKTNVFTAISGFLNKETDERNYFIKTVGEGLDAIHDSPKLAVAAGTLGMGSNTNNVIAIGNGFVTSYTMDASVGELPTCSMTVEGLNMQWDPGTSGNHIPAISPTDGSKLTHAKYALPSGYSHGNTGDYSVDNTWSVKTSALRPGDIQLSFNKNSDGSDYVGEGILISDSKIQSYSLSFDLSREPLQQLGTRFAFSREITFPVTVTLTVDALLGDLTSGTLVDMVNADERYDAKIEMWAPNTLVSNRNGNQRAIIHVKNAELDTQEYSSDIGSNKSVTLTFTSQLAGPSQINKGLQLSGLIGQPNYG